MKFTLIIPTRERAATLQHSLATAVAQDYQDLTILVSDNASNDHTRAVVESFKDSRIQYVNTGHRVDMSSNWEFALRQVSSGFLGYIGDDDGLLPGAVSTAAKIIAEYRSQGVVWAPIMYCWPNHGIPFFRNSLNVPFTPLVARQSGSKAIRRFVGGELTHHTLMSIYQNGFVNLEVIRRLQHQWADGRFFRSSQPDIYSALVLAREVKWFPFSYAPLSIVGASGNSNGGSVLASILGKPNSGAVGQYLNEVKEVPFFDGLEYCDSFGFAYGDALLRSLEQADGTVPNEKDMVVQILGWIARDVATHPGEAYKRGIQAIRKTAARYQLQTEAERLIARYPHTPQPDHPTEPPRSAGWRFPERSLSLNAAEFGVTNVAEAARFCGRLLGYERGRDLSLEMDAAWRGAMLRIFGGLTRRSLGTARKICVQA